MKRSCADDTRRCGTPGCNLTDRHARLRTDTFVDGPRRNGTGFFQAPDFRIGAAGAARDVAVAPAAAPAVADENGNGAMAPVIAWFGHQRWVRSLMRGLGHRRYFGLTRSRGAPRPPLSSPAREPASRVLTQSSHIDRGCRVFNTGPLVSSLPVARTAPVT